MLAMGLGAIVYGWTEHGGVTQLNAHRPANYIMSLDFSSSQGGKGILAYGLVAGHLYLMTPDEANYARFEVEHPSAVVYMRWRPTVTRRPSKSPFHPGVPVETEDLVVGDFNGDLFYYIVEWPARWEVERDTWPGQVTLVARIHAHQAQVCGLAWAPSGYLFASGSNDNHCCLFSVAQIFGPARRRADGVNTEAEGRGSELDRLPTFEFGGREWEYEEGVVRTVNMAPPAVRNMLRGSERHRWVHGSAVKAIAFCPWLDGLIATGGGTHDKCIRFFHTTTGAALATIRVSAQVTSLIWSTTRREIAATFGFAQPEHPYRIAIFSWPECRQVAAIPWTDGHRALYAIPYPFGPRGEPSALRGRPESRDEGCIVVAGSDRVVRFHEVWSVRRKAMVGRSGMLAGSDILEGLEGMDKEGDVIR
jgi:meiosis-specific APC/C activator protein AMA1